MRNGGLRVMDGITLYQRANCALLALIVAVLFFGCGALWQKRRDA